MKPRPLLSIIIPNYNHAAYLSQTLNSIFDQSFQDFELILGDDASTDQSREIILSYGKRVRAFFFQKNRGYSETVRTLFPEARGEYVHIFSSDDLYLPGFLERSMQLLLSSSVDLVCSNIRYFSQEEERETALYPARAPQIFGRERIVSILRESSFWVPGVSSITSKALIDRYGLPDPKLENISDWFLFHKIALMEGIGFIPQLGIAMREQELSYTNRVKAQRRRRNATYFAILDRVNSPQGLKQRLRDSAALTPVFENLFWKLIYRPRWWGFFARAKFSVRKRLWRSLTKRLRRA